MFYIKKGQKPGRNSESLEKSFKKPFVILLLAWDILHGYDLVNKVYWSNQSSDDAFFVIARLPNTYQVVKGVFLLIWCRWFVD